MARTVSYTTALPVLCSCTRMTERINEGHSLVDGKQAMPEALTLSPTGRLEELQLAARTAAERERAADQSALSHAQCGCGNEAHVRSPIRSVAVRLKPMYHASASLRLPQRLAPWWCGS